MIKLQTDQWLYSSCFLTLLFSTSIHAGVDDPQLKTNHHWYPGELACSTFDELQQTQAVAFERVTGHLPSTDEDKALAAWMWRNTHYAHGEEGVQNLWGEGFQPGKCTTRSYWTGMFAHGFGLCGTTHAQWTVELNSILGHCRSRTVGVPGHNALEVFLEGGAYGTGRWALLDHDVSTVIFDDAGERLLSIQEIQKDLDRLGNSKYLPERQKGWPLGGLHEDDPKAYSAFNVVEHLPGYAGPPPRVSLRNGEALRRYFHPGLDDGKTFVFWGRNYGTAGIPGPERSRTWINQPERFRNNLKGAGYKPGQARYGNAVYRYRPNFLTEGYKEGLVLETEEEVIFEFQTPFIIAATPVDDSAWGIYKAGAKNGLRVSARNQVNVAVSLDHGTSWHSGDFLNGSIDLTDVVKGHQQYWIKIDKNAVELQNSALEIVTVCQANPTMFPRLKDNGAEVHFRASGLKNMSAGPTVPHINAHVVDGRLNTPRVTMKLAPPRDQRPVHVYAAAHLASSNPPDPEIRYQIEYSIDEGRSWQAIVKDWRILRRPNEANDFWSQSFCYGDSAIESEEASDVLIRFRNNGGKKYLRCEAHLACSPPNQQPCQVTFSWVENGNIAREESHVFQNDSKEIWNLKTGHNVKMNWVEFIPHN